MCETRCTLSDDKIDFEVEPRPAHEVALDRLNYWVKNGLPTQGEELIVRELMDRVVGVKIPTPDLNLVARLAFVEALKELRGVCRNFTSRGLVRRTIDWLIRTHHLPESVRPQYPVVALLEKLVSMRGRLGDRRLDLGHWEERYRDGTSRSSLYLEADGLKTHSWSVPHNEMGSRGLTQDAVVNMELVERYQVTVETVQAHIDQTWALPGDDDATLHLRDPEGEADPIV